MQAYDPRNQTSGGSAVRRSPLPYERRLRMTAWIQPVFRLPAFALCLLLPATSEYAQSQSPPPDASHTITVLVTGEDHQPLAGALVQGSSNSQVICSGTTGTSGQTTLNCPPVSPLSIEAILAGYLEVSTVLSTEDLANGSAVEIALAKAPPIQEAVTVKAETANPLTESASSEVHLPVEDAKSSPLRPSTLIDTLPLVPGVVRTPDGRVQIGGLGEQHSALIVNSVTVNDPATGAFGLSVPVDTVETVKVLQSPYLAQYGSFIAGVVSADTRRGGEKWDYSLNDPLPDFRIRSGHLVGLRDASPRLNFSGPLIANRLYIVEGSEYLIDKAQVRTLPFPENETRSTAFNSFTQFDAMLGSRDTLTATLHFAPHSLRYAGLNYFDPQPVTPNADYQEDTGVITERRGIHGGILASTFAGTRVASNSQAQQGADGPEMVLSPTGNSGGYFGTQSREATRFQWLETWTPRTIEAAGQHLFQFGTVAAHAEDEGAFTGHNVRINGSQGNLLRTISFSGNGTFNLSDIEMAAYAQDHWVPNSHLAFDAGVRTETQSLTYTSRLAPRGGFTWSPGKNPTTIVRGGLGIFYDAVPLDTYAFSSYPQQTITTYDGFGNVIDGPRLYSNVTGTIAIERFPFLSQLDRSGNFAPYNVSWNLEAERSFGESFLLRARYIHSDAQNQLTLDSQTTPALSALILDGAGNLHSRQIDLTARVGASKQRQFFFSYVRQFAKGDVSDASSYLGDFPYPVVRSQIVSRTSGEVPNRFLLWGTSTLPWRFRVTPHVEYRNGFTWQPVDELQNYVAFASYAQPRYPRYFSADLRVAKDLNVGPKHAIRLSLTTRNLTDHTNPLQVHNNTADPQFGQFFGDYGRHFLADFDFLF